jgi:CxxC motif-containing protein
MDNLETRNLICIGCPMGCPLTVRMENGQITVTGNTCKRGADYGQK